MFFLFFSLSMFLMFNIKWVDMFMWEVVIFKLVNMELD